MNKDTKRLINDNEFNSLSAKRVRHNVTCLLDLPNEIFILMCRYLSSAHVLYAFYTPEIPDYRLHRIICDYYRKIKLSGIPISSLRQIIIDVPDGLMLYKTLIPNKSITHIDLVLENIDDLYVLLDGLVPNVEKVRIYLRQSRILSRRHPESLQSCVRLTQFTLLESGIELIVEDIKSILSHMRNLIKLTLSIRDTYDPVFCNGPLLESILNEYVPNLRQFDYTMTHRISDQTLFEDFTGWKMNSVYYENDNCGWIHIYSLPWPSNKDDKRQLPIIKDGYNRSVRSNVEQSQYMKDVMITTGNELTELKTRYRCACEIRTCLPIDIELPSRISKVILTQQTRIISINNIVQPFVRHLIVKQRLTDEKEISILGHQFPNVEYLRMLFPFERTLSIRCFQTLFNVDENVITNRRLWKKLKNISIEFSDNQINQIFDGNNIINWFMRNTDLKFIESGFYWIYFNKIVSIWL